MFGIQKVQVKTTNELEEETSNLNKNDEVSLKAEELFVAINIYTKLCLE